MEETGKPLNSEDLLRIARGDDPHRPPMWNGLPRMTTPTQVPTRPMADDGQLFEFLFPYPIHIFDSSEWPPLRITRDGIEIHLLKPMTTPVTAKEQLAAGNECPDLYFSNVRAVVLTTSQGYPTTHDRVFEIVRHTLQWVRILSRQFWIGIGSVGVAAASRGSVFTTEGAAVRQMNYAVFGSTILVRALPLRFWVPLGACVTNNEPVPVSESIYCDGLASFAAGDIVRCLVELGIAGEIELSNLLDDSARLNPSSAGAKKYRKERRTMSFEQRLLTCPSWLGAESVGNFTVPNMPPDWVEKLLLLYRFRNKAAHEGRAVVSDGTGSIRPLAPGELQSFIFSMEVFYRWSKEQRMKLGLIVPGMSIDRSQQIIAILGDPQARSGLVMGTSESSNIVDNNPTPEKP